MVIGNFWTSPLIALDFVCPMAIEQASPAGGSKKGLLIQAQKGVEEL
jgi:hypothetical protein